MKTRAYSILIAVLLTACSACGQGILARDQYSSLDETVSPGGTIIQDIERFAPQSGQSFTPSLPGVDFIRLRLCDVNPGNGLGATLYVVLRSESISGPTIGTTTPVVMPSDAVSLTTFFFPSTVSVTPETMYFFQIHVQSGDLVAIWGQNYNYQRGTYVADGTPQSASDLWFQEGIVVPEPSATLLALLGAGVIYSLRVAKKLRSKQC